MVFEYQHHKPTKVYITHVVLYRTKEKAMKSVFALCLLIVLPALSKAIAVYVCEGETYTLGCASGNLNIISANFGRTLNSVCTSFSNIQNTNCRYDGSLAKVRSVCQNKRACVLDSSVGFFNGVDPCPGIYKYIAMDYTCQ